MNTTTTATNTLPANPAVINGAAAQATKEPVNKGSRTNEFKELNLPDQPAIVAREDYTKRPFLFLADTQDKGGGMLKAWDVSGNKLIDVPMAFYKSTFKLEEATALTSAIQKFSKASGIKQVIQRQRLFKNGQNVLPKDADGKVDKVDVSDVKAQLLQQVMQIQKAIEELL